MRRWERANRLIPKNLLSRTREYLVSRRVGSHWAAERETIHGRPRTGRVRREEIPLIVIGLERWIWGWRHPAVPIVLVRNAPNGILESLGNVLRIILVTRVLTGNVVYRREDDGSIHPASKPKGLLGLQVTFVLLQWTNRRIDVAHSGVQITPHVLESEGCIWYRSRTKPTTSMALDEPLREQKVGHSLSPDLDVLLGPEPLWTAVLKAKTV